MATINKIESPKVEVGEIDTRAPFQSVKDAVNLFGEGAFSGEKITIKKIKPHSAERVLVKETRLHLAQKEIYKLKEQLKSADTTKTDALTELERAKRTVDDLKKKLEITKEAKRAAENQAKQFDSRETNPNGGLKQDLENTKQQYATVFTELDAAKLELRRIHHDRETAFEEQNAATKQETGSEVIKDMNLDRVGEISKEITSVQKSLERMKLTTMEAQREQEKVFAEKNVQRLAHKAALEDSAKILLALRERVDPEKPKDYKTEMESTRALDLDSLKTVTSDLVGAKDSLHKVVEEESSLKKLVASLRIELENVKKEHEELKAKEAETESVAGNLNSKLQESEIKFENVCVEEAKATGASDEMMSTFQKVMVENENAKRESEEMKEKADELRKEAEAMRVALKEVESKLKIALMEADDAKQAESKALDEKEAVKKLESTRKEIDDLKAATEAALKRAEMAERCRKAVEGELKRWRDKEQKKAAEAMALILEERQMQQTPSTPSIPSHKQSPSHKTKKILICHLSGMFHRKKSQVDAGSSPSYLPGEKPM